MSASDDYLKSIDQNIAQIKNMIAESINSQRESVGEIPTKMLHFIMYMHAMHDVLSMYREGGHEAPKHIKDEVERCDDRLRQLLSVEHSEEGTFAKVRREMAEDPNNRWDHTRQLTKGESK